MDQDLDMADLNKRLLVLHIRENAPKWISGLKDHQRDFECILREWHEDIYPDRKNFSTIPDLRLFEPAKKFIGYMASSKAFDGIENLYGWILQHNHTLATDWITTRKLVVFLAICASRMTSQ